MRVTISLNDCAREAGPEVAAAVPAGFEAGRTLVRGRRQLSLSSYKEPRCQMRDGDATMSRRAKSSVEMKAPTAGELDVGNAASRASKGKVTADRLSLVIRFSAAGNDHSVASSTRLDWVNQTKELPQRTTHSDSIGQLSETTWSRGRLK